MASTKEKKIMSEIGFPRNYRYYASHPRNADLANKAIGNLPIVLQKHGFMVNNEWLQFAKTASRVDSHTHGQYGIINVWNACSMAIQDATEKENIPPDEDTYLTFPSRKSRTEWYYMQKQFDEMIYIPRS